MTGHREARGAVGSGSVRVSRPVPAGGHRVASAPAVRADLGPAVLAGGHRVASAPAVRAGLGPADSVAPAATIDKADRPPPPAHGPGSRVPAGARNARGRIAGTTASAVPGTTEAGIPVHRVPGGTPPRSNGLSGPGKGATRAVGPNGRRRAIARPSPGRITVLQARGGISRGLRAMLRRSHGTNRAPIPATRLARSRRPTPPLSLAGWRRANLPNLWRRARSCHPDRGPAAPRTPAAPAALAVPRRDRAAPTSGTGRTTHDARSR